MERPIVIGVGEFLWDVLPEGKKAGGAPVNFAYHASQHGAEGWGVTAVGRDALGDELVGEARSHGINLCVSRVNHPTGTVQVTVNEGIPTYKICEGVAWDYIPLTEEALSLARRAAAVSFGTLGQRAAVSRETTVALVEAAARSALRVYDINLRQNFYNKELIVKSLNIANVFKINDEELEILKEMFGITELDTDAACKYFIDNYGLYILVLTGGDVFSSIYTANEISTLPTPHVEVVDSVGAGDAFSGAFIGSILSGKTIVEAHRVAVETAAYVCTQAGAWTQGRGD